MIKDLVRRTIRRLGYDISKVPRSSSSKDLYQPLYSPWLSAEFARYYAIAAPRTLVSIDRCYILERLFKQSLPIGGDIFECGVYRGGTAAMLAALLAESKTTKKLYLFDSFDGMPGTDADRDFHKKGDFSDTSYLAVKSFVGNEENCIIRKGFIPETFEGLANLTISFCHIDLDIYKSIYDALEFVWPRLALGGIIVIDDYGFPSCPGAVAAVDEFFAHTRSVPICLQTGQAIIFKGAG